MRVCSKTLLLLTAGCLLQVLVATRQTKQVTYPSRIGVQEAQQLTSCQLELQLVVCGIPAHLQTAQQRNLQQQCCDGWDHQRPAAQLGDHKSATTAPDDSIPANGSSNSSSGTPSASPLEAAAAGMIQAVVNVVEQRVLEAASALASLNSVDEATRALRPDLDPSGPLNHIQPNFYYGTCTRPVEVIVPVFPADNKSIQHKKQTVPQRLSKTVIRQTKALAISNLRSINFAGYSSLAHGMNDKESAKVQTTFKNLRVVDRHSSFIHPGGIIGPAELALMKERLADNSPLQKLALNSLLTGSMVPPKQFSSAYWMQRDTPLNYQGPYPMHTFTARYNGFSLESIKDCPKNLPKGVPAGQCAHIALVELDARQAYKQAVAFWATGNSKYAQNTLRIIDAWSTTNTKFGLAWENGPLEAGWSVASFARALELLRGRVGGWDTSYRKFQGWVNRLLMPLMDEYWKNSQDALGQGKLNLMGNWHSTIAEAWMAMGVLADDRSRYNKAVGLYHATVKDYFKWGQGQHKYSVSAWRSVGEASETLRDIYHTQFALGGMLQVAEMAWQQDDDLYSSNDYALAAALELHAKIILAGDDESKLPYGFRLEKSMPPPPKGCKWRFDYQRQLWTAVNPSTGKWVSDLKNGVKYLVGIKFLPTGWELGYNHYVGRLGLKMPQTQALIRQHYVDWYEMHFGLGTMSHANTAALLWRVGLKQATVCAKDHEMGVKAGHQSEPYTPYLSMFHL